MAPSITFFFLSIFVTFVETNFATPNPTCDPKPPPHLIPIHPIDVSLLQFAINLEHLEADFFLYGALGYGLDEVAPALVMGGPKPIGARKANLDKLTRNIIAEFGYQEVGHLRYCNVKWEELLLSLEKNGSYDGAEALDYANPMALHYKRRSVTKQNLFVHHTMALKSTVGGFPRPLMDLSSHNFAKIFDAALGYRLDPPFDPYRNSISYMLGSYVIPYMGLVSYVGANPYLIGYISKRLQAGLLGVEAGQDAVIRMYLYERVHELVPPYNLTIELFTTRISMLRNRLAGCGIKDEGLIVPPELGAEGRISSNVLSVDNYSLSYAETPAEVLRVVYGTGRAHIPGGFFPEGANGTIAREYLQPCVGGNC